MKCLIKAWATAEIVPIYKRYNPEKPNSYRPIAILSNGRKMIESGIAKMMTDKYIFSNARLGFLGMA